MRAAEKIAAEKIAAAEKIEAAEKIAAEEVDNDIDSVNSDNFDNSHNELLSPNSVKKLKKE